MTYLTLKHAHMVLVLLSVLLFNLRFGLYMCQKGHVLPKWSKIVPHVNDSLLLVSGLGLLHVGGWVPFGNAMWLGWKLVLLVMYVLLGYHTLQKTPQRRAWLWWLFSMACVLAMASLAHFKPLLG